MKNLKFEEVENILEELVTEYLHGIGENTDEDGKDRKSTRLNSSHSQQSRMPSSA